MTRRHPLITATLALAALASSALAAETITINFSAVEEPMAHMASGLLHPFLDDLSNPPPALTDELYTPLNMKYLRSKTGNIIKYHEKDPDATIIGTLSGSWGYPSGGATPPWTNWTNWETFVRNQVTACVNVGLHPVYDFWNEPDGGEYFLDWPGATWDLFNETYKRAYTIIRQLDPQAKVSGPGLGDLNDGFDLIDALKDYCVANSCVPDYWSWHFGAERIVAQVAHTQAWNLNDGAIILEYTNPQATRHPGRTLWEIAYLEASDAVFACRANWGIYYARGTLSGLVFDAGDHWAKRGTWWAYEAYGASSGDRAGYTASSVNVNCIPVIDNSKSIAWIVFGNKENSNGGGYQGDVNVVMKGIRPAQGSTVHVTVTRIPDNNHNEVASLPAPAVDRDLTVSGDSATFAFAYTEGLDAYKAVVTGVRAVSTGADDRRGGSAGISRPVGNRIVRYTIDGRRIYPGMGGSSGVYITAIDGRARCGFAVSVGCADGKELR